MKKKRVLGIILAVALTLSLAGCGNSGSSATVEDTPADKVEETAETIIPEAELTSGGKQIEAINIGLGNDPERLGPFTSRSNGAKPILPLIYETLGARDKFSGEFYGVLMESYEQIDEKTYDVKLYENIFDTAGNPLTAADVEFSFSKTKEIGELGEISKLDSVKAIDDYSVEFKWVNEMALGDFEAAMSGFYVVTEAAYTGSSDEMATKPIGTSPYMVDEFISGSAVVLKASDNYWQSDDNKKVPTQFANVKTITYQIITESSQMTMALQTGTIDITADCSADDLYNFQDGGQYDAQYDVYSTPRIQAYDLCPNVSADSPLNDENLRKAVFAAIDTKTMALSISGGQANVSYTFGSNVYSDYNTDWEKDYFTYDIDAAKEYLSASAYPDGTKLVIELKSSDANQGTIAELLQAYLGQIGIDLEIKAVSQADFLADEPNTKAWDLRLLTFSADDYLTNCWAKYFDVNIVGTGMTKNFIEDETLQGLIETCTSIDGHTEENINAFHEYTVEHAYCMGLVQLYDNIVYNPEIIKAISRNQNNYIVPGAFEYVE